MRRRGGERIQFVSYFPTDKLYVWFGRQTMKLCANGKWNDIFNVSDVLRDLFFRFQSKASESSKLSTPEYAMHVRKPVHCSGWSSYQIIVPAQPLSLLQSVPVGTMPRHIVHVCILSSDRRSMRKGSGRKWVIKTNCACRKYSKTVIDHSEWLRFSTCSFGSVHTIENTMRRSVSIGHKCYWWTTDNEHKTDNNRKHLKFVHRRRIIWNELLPLRAHTHAELVAHSFMLITRCIC